MEATAYEKTPEAVPVVATATGSDSDGTPVWGLVTRSRGGRVYYISVWTTGPRKYRGSWKTHSRAEVDQALATLRENGLDVKEYDRP